MIVKKTKTKKTHHEMMDSETDEDEMAELKEAAVSGESVLQQVNVYKGEDRFSKRVEEGEFKKKKKKAKKKKKVKIDPTAIGTEEN